MEITIDQAGRIVIPKSLRNRLGLIAGARFKVSVNRDSLILKPILSQPRLIQVDGIFHQGKAQTDLAHAVEQSREERIRDLTRET